MLRFGKDQKKYYDVEDVKKELGVTERTAYNIIKKYVPEVGTTPYSPDPDRRRNKNIIEERYFYDMILNYKIDKGIIDLPTEKEQKDDDINYLNGVIQNILSRCVIFYGNLDDPTLDHPIENKPVKKVSMTDQKITTENDGLEMPFDFHIMNKELFEEWKKQYFKKHNIKENDEK